MSISWERLLAEKHKVFFSSYVHLEKGFANEFYYQNGGQVAEEVVAVFFHSDGRRVAEIPPITSVLAPAQALVVNASETLVRTGYPSFRGSIMMVVHPTAVVDGDDLSQRDFVCYWSSGPARHAVHIGIGGLKEQNVTGKKENKIYNMFCPTILSTDTRKTVVVILNHSTDPTYADEVTLMPVLSNLNGERMEGPVITARAFGAFLVDVDEVFGEKGQRLLRKTGGRGVVTVLHRGHVFITLFFHIDKKTKEIVSGTHTTPAASIPYNYAIKHPFLNSWAERNPVFYFAWCLKHFRTLPWFVNLYPPRPLLMNSVFSYVAQSRWVLQGTYLLRALFFLARRRFHITVLEDAGTGHLKQVVYNQLWEDFNAFHFCRARVEMLLNLLLLTPANRRGKTLCIGPRNEGEILLFRGWFSDVVGIDLFSYTPSILVMDAHHMTFPDCMFDTINCGWVLTYVYDLPQVVREI